MLVGLILTVAGGPAFAASDTFLEPGDVLEFSVASVPTLQRRITVGADGQIVVPPIGEIKAQGLTVGQLRDAVRRVIQTKPIVYRASDGREILVNISPDEVVIEVADYRPVYVLGDVAKPGQVVFRPGMTIRQAVAVAGGYDRFHDLARLPQTDVAALRGEMSAQWIQYVKLTARQDRLRRELGKPAEGPGVSGAPLPKDLVAEIVNADTEEAAAQNARYDRERAHFERAMKDAERRITGFASQRKTEEEAAQLDAGEVDRVNDLYRRNVVPISRVTDTRRLSLVSATRALQIGVQAEAVRKELEDLTKSYQALEDRRRVAMLNDLRETIVALSTTRAKLRSIADRIPIADTDPTAGDREVSLYRKGEPGDGRQVTDEGEELRPGDVVEVKFAHVRKGAF